MPNNVPANYFSDSYRDYAGEVSTISMNVGEFTDNPAFAAARTAYLNAVSAITDGQRALIVTSLTQSRNNASSAVPASHREKKILVSYQDTVNGLKFSATIPTRDDSAVTYLLNSDFLDLTATLEAAFVTAFEAFVISPYGNAIEVLSMKAVGRNI